MLKMVNFVQILVKWLAERIKIRFFAIANNFQGQDKLAKSIVIITFINQIHNLLWQTQKLQKR